MPLFSVCWMLGMLGSCSDEPATGVQGDTGNDASVQDLRERDLTDQGTEPDLRDGGDAQSDATDGSPDGQEDWEDTASDVAGDNPDGTDSAAEVDSPDDASELADVAEEEVLDCPPDRPAHVGVLLEDFNQAPLQVNDRVKISITVIPDTASSEPGWLWADISNLDILTGTVRRNDTFLDAGAFSFEGERLEIPLVNWEAATYSVEGSVEVDWQLVSVRAGLAVGERECEVTRSRSGALLQVIGGESKTPFCLDMTQFRSVQLAPMIPLQNTTSYAQQNGQRTDLWADDFIFCPQNPTIVHATEFCLTRQAGQSITLAGHYEATATWEVDDFTLIEVLEASELLDDGCTTQTHPGDNTFWCGETQENPCPTPGCQATLTVIAEERVIEPIGVASSLGDCPRCFDDGAVALDNLLPTDGHAVDVRVTALDMGIEGELQPALYILSSDPE